MLPQGLVERGATQSLAPEKMDCRLQMGLAFGEAPAGRERGHEIAMRRFVKRQDVQQFANVGKRLVCPRQQRGDPRQHVRMKSLESLTLPDEPDLEQGKAIRLKTLEELALELRRQPLEEIEVAPRSRPLDVLCDPQGVDLQSRRVDGHPIAFGLHALIRRLVQETADFGQAPAQLVARIAGDVPKHLAQPGAMDRTRRHDEIRDERPHFARGRERRVSPVSRDF